MEVKVMVKVRWASEKWEDSWTACCSVRTEEASKRIVHYLYLSCPKYDVVSCYSFPVHQGGIIFRSLWRAQRNLPRRPYRVRNYTNVWQLKRLVHGLRMCLYILGQRPPLRRRWRSRQQRSRVREVLRSRHDGANATMEVQRVGRLEAW